MKRFFDIVFACVLFIILSPLLLFLSVLVKATSKGPVLFKQRRIGKDKQEFMILKFRTMYVDAPQNVPTHLLDNPDKLITPIGRILRKTSLDELPQLINIIKGHMGFVGPRPALYNQYDLIALRDQYDVNRVRPGITGWAQVNGRDELPIPVKVEYDRQYVERMSVLFDIKIICMTAISVIVGKGVVEGKQSVNGTINM